MEPLQAQSHASGIVPQGWEGWAAVVVILTSISGAYWWWRDRIYQKGYRAGRDDQRKQDESEAFKELRADIKALKGN